MNSDKQDNVTKDIKAFNGKLTFTGERVTPDMFYESNIFMEHFARYFFAKDFCLAKKVIDIGCGYGYGTKYLSGFAKEALGIDVSEEAISYANEKYANKQCAFSVKDCIEIGTMEERFDVGVCFELIEHLPSECHQDFMQGVAKILKKDALLVVSTPNYLIYKGKNPFHKKEYTPSEFNRMLRMFYHDVRLFAQNKSPFAIGHAEQHKALYEMLFILSNLPRIAVNKILPKKWKFAYKEVNRMPLSFGHNDFIIENFSDLDRASYIIAVCSSKKMESGN
jgi:2-polyprenyl-3-methyl-5-hydroxy-6-metoxy-1,4-benzoquinol methylase